MENIYIALSILIPFGIGLYTYAIIRFNEQIKGNNKLIGWTIKEQKDGQS